MSCERDRSARDSSAATSQQLSRTFSFPETPAGQPRDPENLAARRDSHPREPPQPLFPKRRFPALLEMVSLRLALRRDAD
jgi:hypothetical protein